MKSRRIIQLRLTERELLDFDGVAHYYEESFSRVVSRTLRIECAKIAGANDKTYGHYPDGPREAPKTRRVILSLSNADYVRLLRVARILHVRRSRAIVRSIMEEHYKLRMNPCAARFRYSPRVDEWTGLVALSSVHLSKLQEAVQAGARLDGFATTPGAAGLLSLGERALAPEREFGQKPGSATDNCARLTQVRDEILSQFPVLGSDKRFRELERVAAHRGVVRAGAKSARTRVRALVDALSRRCPGLRKCPAFETFVAAARGRAVAVRSREIPESFVPYEPMPGRQTYRNAAGVEDDLQVLEVRKRRSLLHARVKERKIERMRMCS